MKAEGHAFPPLKESDAMFKAETAPEWAEGTVCFSCRTPFTLVIRKVINLTKIRWICYLVKNPVSLF